MFVSIHKKGEKYLIKNYRPVSLFPIFGKMLKRLIFKSFKHIDENVLHSQASVDLILV